MTRCAVCGRYEDDDLLLEVIFMEGTTYPDYWQHTYDCLREDDDEDGEVEEP